MADERGKPFDGLTPDAVLVALDSVGLRGDGRLLALNSYENRVYQVSLEDSDSGTEGAGPSVVVSGAGEERKSFKDDGKRSREQTMRFSARALIRNLNQ